jgi:hypothetical protein
VSRMTVKIVFGANEDLGSQDDPEPWSPIALVQAKRTATTVGVEDKNVTGQKAHITADVVLERGVERLLTGKDWCEAWHEVHNLWAYLYGIAAVWQEDVTLGAASKGIVRQVLEVADRRKDLATDNVRRQDVDLHEAWFTEPIAGDAETRKSLRTYFDHEPEEDEVTVGCRVAKWRPNLGTDYVYQLAAEVELWVATRVRLPWTSLDTTSQNTSDRTGPRLVEQTIDAVADGDDLTGPEAVAIADAMLVTFDFAPPSITKARTLTHAGAVGARHVVEHFKLHPGIRPEWHAAVAAAFLIRWHHAIRSVTAPAGLVAVVVGWMEVSVAYNRLVTEFSKAALAD